MNYSFTKEQLEKTEIRKLDDVKNKRNNYKGCYE